MELVQVKNNSVFCDSSMIAKKFGVKHAYVIRNCDSLLSDIDEIKGDSQSPLIIKEKRNYRGADYTAYLMDRNFFSLLCMRFKGKEALEWQIKFNNAFYKMEAALIEKEKPASSMIELNELTKIIESNKNIASVCGKQLANYKKVKKQDAERWAKKVKETQLTLGFEE